MTNNKHTPGPWSYHDTSFFTKSFLITSATFDIARALWLPGANNHADVMAESRANARLIAAAPDMLAALIELVARCDGADGVRADGSNIQTMAARAAITKAGG